MNEQTAPIPVMPALYARIEPTVDALLHRYAVQLDQWCDIVFYHDAEATQVYARRCGCLRRSQRAQPHAITLNCVRRPLLWLPELARTEVR